MKVESGEVFREGSPSIEKRQFRSIKTGLQHDCSLQAVAFRSLGAGVLVSQPRFHQNVRGRGISVTVVRTAYKDFGEAGELFSTILS